MSLFKRLIVQSEEDENGDNNNDVVTKEDIKEVSTEDVVVKEQAIQKELIEEDTVAQENKMEKLLRGNDSEEKEEEMEQKDVVKKIRVFDTSPNEDFWFHYGPVVKNLAELRDAFLQIDDNLYNYHANGNENDFEVWIKDVFGYEELAKKIGSAKTRKKAHKILEDAVE